MAIIGHVEARSLRGRLMQAGILLALALGGLSMVYPFAVMVSGSLRSEMDEADFDLAPDYLTDDDAVYRKFLETKYNQNVALLNRTRLEDHTRFGAVDPPPPADPAQVDALRAYLADDALPAHWQTLGGIVGVRAVPEPLRELRRRVMKRYGGDLDALGRDLGAPVASWHEVSIASPDWALARFDYEPGPIHDAYFDMLHDSDPAERVPVSITGLFLQTIVFPRYGSTRVDAFNAAHASPIRSFSQFRLPAQLPPEDDPALRAEWLEFVLHELNPSFVVVHGATAADYDAFQRSIGQEPRHALPDGRSWLSGEPRQVYERFLHAASPVDLRIVGPEYDPRGAHMFTALADLERGYALDHAGELRRRYAARNFITVFDELLIQGRALANTVIYCTLAIVLALLVNPLAAYGLSRFRLPGTYRILLVLLVTISFPPMVTLIPQFILLRKLDLLNSFTALVLPLVANSYMIFLLKGFFDALPRELYESARIDGAGEIRMFFQFTMALSKPILAVLALSTFTAAYTAFLYPLLVAPDPDRWIISVWLFQFQQRAATPAVYASVLVASIPTLVIFLLTQRTIMRGIVVPTEK